MKYALFKMVKQSGSENGGGFFLLSSFYSAPPEVEGDEWKKQQEKSEPVYSWQFISFVKSPKELAEHIRKDPLSKYSVMQGEIHPIQSTSMFFMQGKNLDTMEAEWT